jgi:hypothetical protein
MVVVRKGGLSERRTTLKGGSYRSEENEEDTQRLRPKLERFGRLEKAGENRHEISSLRVSGCRKKL